MCLIIVKPEHHALDEQFLQGVFSRNSDGIGAMWADDGKLYHVKCVPKTFDDVRAFWQEHADARNCAVHFRMMTHGPVQQSNSHPFEVLGPDDGHVLWMMHNGVLKTGNAEDPSKTDTELFIKNFLRPMLLGNPLFFTTKEFADLIGSFIGYSNKFVLLDHLGNQVIINETSFVTHGGAKLSNTYAWDSPKPVYTAPTYSWWKGKPMGTTVKRAPAKQKPTKRGGKGTSEQLPLRPTYPAHRDTVLGLMEQLEQTGSKAYERTTYLAMEKLVEYTGRWNAEYFIKMLGDGRLDIEDFMDGVTAPAWAETLIDAADEARLASIYGGFQL